MHLPGKVVFVTGGAAGLGEACVRAVVAEGAKVVIADVDEKLGGNLVQDLNAKFGKETALYVKCDVTDKSSFDVAFQTAVEKCGRVHVMLNNAGVASEIHWEKTVDINFKGVVRGTELAFSHMRRDRGGDGGVIVNIASYAGYHPFYMFPVYSATKYAVVGYTRSMASAPDQETLGVRYACICPRRADTKLASDIQQTSREEYTDVVKKLFSQHLLSPDLVAQGLLSLIADDDSNDTLLEVDQYGHYRKQMIVVDAKQQKQ